MTRHKACASDLRFDQLLAGDLATADAGQVRMHLTECPACAARYAALQAERDRFDAAPPPLALGPQRLGGATSKRVRAATGVALLAAASVALALFSPAVPPGSSRPGRVEIAPPVNRAKGGEHFQLFIRHGESMREAGQRELTYPGDQLQFVYSAQRDGYLAVLSVDGAGAASVYFPDQDATAWKAPVGRQLPLPRSTILDQTLGHERIYALFCGRAIALEPLRTALARGPEAAGAECTIETFELEKRAAK